MKKNLFISTFFSLLLFFSITTQALESGNKVLLQGDSAASMGRGGTGIAEDGSDLIYSNPASLGRLERLNFGLQFGGFSFFAPDFTVAVPTSYGVFGGGFKMVTLPKTKDTADLQTGYLFNVSAGKALSSHVTIGASLEFMFGKDATKQNVYFPGLTLGAIYKFNYNKEFVAGFGLYDPRLAFSVKAGIPIPLKNNAGANLNTATFGYQFAFFQHKNALISFYNEVSAVDAYRHYSVKLGLESLIFDHYIIRLGGVIGDYYNYGDLNFGLGYKLDIKGVSLDANYTLALNFGSTPNHYFGVNLKYGELDITPPVTVVESSQKYISPNHDGVQDYVEFKLGVDDASVIKGWQLKITDQKDNVVKEYRVSSREIEDTLTVKDFFQRIWQKKESLVVPDKIMWDGTDQKGVLLNDGLYKYNFIAWDEKENYSVIKNGNIIVDNNQPAASISAKNLLFSPNGDKNKDELIISQKIVTEPNDVWQAKITNAAGDIVKTYSWSGKDIPAKLKWDGKDDAGEDVPNGLYHYAIASQDNAGNAIAQEITQIALTRDYQNIDVNSANYYYSYNNKEKEFNFLTEISDVKGLQSWKLIIETESGKVIREIIGGNELPRLISWDVKNADGKEIKDGKYLYSLVAEFDSGNKPASFKKELALDSTAPNISLKFSPSLFSPDDDGENDVLTFKPKVSDDFEVNDWIINIYNSTGILFKQISGTGIPADEIKWDGLSSKQELVESATDYKLEFIVKDKAGNIAKINDLKLPIDVLVIATERGLKIRISNIEFGFGSAKIMRKSNSILNRVAQILEKYSSYGVVIEGHTDDIGKDEYNLKLSEQRALSVKKYLIKKGVDEERLTIRGMGETSPYIENNSEDNRRKNRRVEFLLIKDTAQFEKQKNVTSKNDVSNPVEDNVTTD